MSNVHTQNHAHVVPAMTYHITLAKLAALMGLTIWASYIQFPGGVMVNNAVAMIIAITKAYLVVTIFMGVKYQTELTKFWAALGFVWVTLMSGILIDYFARPFEHVRGWENNQQSAMPRIRGFQDPNQPLPTENELNVHTRN